MTIEFALKLFSSLSIAVKWILEPHLHDRIVVWPCWSAAHSLKCNLSTLQCANSQVLYFIFFYSESCFFSENASFTKSTNPNSPPINSGKIVQIWRFLRVKNQNAKSFVWNVVKSVVRLEWNRHLEWWLSKLAVIIDKLIFGWIVYWSTVRSWSDLFKMSTFWLSFLFPNTNTNCRLCATSYGIKEFTRSESSWILVHSSLVSLI